MQTSKDKLNQSLVAKDERLKKTLVTKLEKLKLKSEIEDFWNQNCKCIPNFGRVGDFI